MVNKKCKIGGMAGLVTAILVAHTAGDLLFRVHEWLRINQTLFGYLLHVLIWAGSISIVLAVYKRFTVSKFIFLAVTHFIIDFNKVYLIAFGRNEGYIIDQILHLITIILVFI